MHGNDEPVLILFQGGDGMVDLFAIEEDEHTRGDLQLQFFHRVVGAAGMEAADEAGRGLVLESDQHGPSAVLIVGGVIMEAHVIALLGVGIEDAAMGVGSGAFLEVGVDELLEELQKRWALVDLIDGRGEASDSFIADASTLFVARDEVAMDMGFKRLQFFVPKLQDKLRKAIGYNQKLILVEILLAELLGVKSGESLPDKVVYIRLDNHMPTKLFDRLVTKAGAEKQEEFGQIANHTPRTAKA